MKEVCSPISRRGSKLSGNIPGSSPGARSNPSRGDQTSGAGHQPEPSTPASGNSGKEPARGDSVSPGQSMMDYYLQRSLGAAQIKFVKPGD
jgi:hypothetical protein